MITAIGLTAMMLTAAIDDPTADFIKRVENTEWLGGDGKAIPRVERDAKGNVTKLSLSGMKLFDDDFGAVAGLKTLQNLNLYRTNVTNANLRKLRELPRLQGLNLTSTEITDAAIDEIVKIESLRSLCLGNVAVTPEAVARLKEHFCTQKKSLSLGYFQRK
jgi:hypothetical protein